MEVRFHPIVGAEWWTSHAGCVWPAESASNTQWTGSWIGELAERKKILFLLEIEPRVFGSPVRSVVTVPTEPSRLLNSCAAYANVFSNIFTRAFHGYWYWKNKEQHLCTQWIDARHVVEKKGIPPPPGIEGQSFIPWPITRLIKLPQFTFIIYCPIPMVLTHVFCHKFISGMDNVLTVEYRRMFRCAVGKWNAMEASGWHVTFRKDKRGLEPLYK
jgi:hypothetical protein